MRSDTVFISGRVTGIPREEAERNFERGEKLCRNNAYNYINPLKHVCKGATNTEAISQCIELLTKRCDYILLLDDRELSEGSKIEESVARYGGMKIFYEEDLT